MTDYSNLSDEELAKIAGVQLDAPAAIPAAAPSPAPVAAAPAPVSTAILNQESGNNSKIQTSVDGAIGPGQILPGTFAQYAKPGERIDNADDNRAVHSRIIADYNQRYNNDPARVAVAYFSGPGNVAPANSPTPYLADHKDGNGKSTSAYVSDVLGRIGNGIMPSADAAEPNPAAAPSAAIPAPATAPSAPSTAPTSAPQASAPTQPDQFAGMSDEELAKIAGVPLSSSHPTPPGMGDYLEGVYDSAKHGVKTFADLTDVNTRKGPIGDPIAAMHRADDALGKWDKGDYVGGALGVSRAALDRFNDAMRDTVPGKIFQGGAQILGAPVAPVYNAGVKVLQAGGVPNDIIEGAGNLSPLLALRGKAPVADEPVAPAGAAPGSPPPPPPGQGPIIPPEEAAAAANAGGGNPPPPPPGAGPTGGGANPPPPPPGGGGTTAGVNPPGANPFGRKSDPIPDSLKRDDAGKELIMSPKAQRQGHDLVKDALADEGMGKQDLLNAADKVEQMNKDGLPYTMVDALTDTPGQGRNLWQLLSATASRPGQGSRLAGALSLRGKTAANDIGGLFDRTVSNTPYANVKKGAIQSMEGTGDMYKAAFSANQDMMTPGIKNVLDTPSGNKALNAAVETMQNDRSTVGVRNPDLVEQAQLSGQPIPKGGISNGLKMKTLLYVKNELWDLAQKERDPANGFKYSANGRAILKNYHDLNNEMKANDLTRQPNDPESGFFAQANKTYSTAARQSDALKMGEKFTTMHPEDIKEYMQSVSEPERAAALSGFRRSVTSIAGRKQPGQNPIVALNNVNMRGRYEAALGDAAKADDLIKSLDAHQHMHEINGVLGNSATAYRQQFNDKINGGDHPAAKVVHTMIEPQGAAANMAKGAINSALNKRMEKMSSDKATAIVRLLTTKDPAAIRYMANQLPK